MTAREVKAQLVLKGVSYARIAEILGVTRQLVGAVVRGTAQSARVEAAIAAVLNTPVHEVFDRATRQVAA